MADEILRFDIIGSAASAAAAFGETADSSELAARGARACAMALERESAAAGTSVDATLALARADAILAEANEGLATDSIEADAALRQQAIAADEAAAAEQKAADASAEMGAMWLKGAMGLAAVGFGAYEAVKSATSFQAAITMLGTQAGVAKNQLGTLGAGVLKLAGQTGNDPDSLADSLYHVESSFASVGITAPKALELVKTAAEGARIGGANLVDVQNALDATIVAGVPGVKNYSQAMGVLNAIVGSGDMHMEDLAEAMGSGVMAVAKNYGQTIYQVGAALAVLGDNNIRGARAATDLRMAWQAMEAPIKAGLPLLKSIGITSTQLGEEMSHHGLSSAIDMFIEHLRASKVPMADWGMYETEIFGKKAGVGIGILISQYDRLMSKFPDMKKGAAGFGAAWDATQATMKQRLADLRGTFDALVTTIGLKLIPVVTALAGFALSTLIPAIGKVVGWLERNRDAVIAAGIGIMAALVPAMIAWTTAAVAAAAATIAAAAPLIAVGVAVAALAFGILYLADHWKRVWHDITAWAADAFDWVKDHWPLLLGILAGPVGLAAAEIITHFRDVEQWGKDAWDAIADAADWAWHFIDDHLIRPLEHGTDELVHWVSDGLGRLGHIMEVVFLAPFDLVIALFTGNYSRLSALTGGLVIRVADWFEQLPGRILHALGDLGSMLFRAGVRAIEGLLNGMKSVVGGAISTVEGWGHDLVSAIGHPFGIHFSEPSEATQMIKAGRNIAEGLGTGMDQGRSSVIAAAQRLSTAAGVTGAIGTAGAYGASGGMTVRLEIGGNSGPGINQLFMTWLKNEVRGEGGSPDIFTRKVVFA